jgi:hypothetical protein
MTAETPDSDLVINPELVAAILTRFIHAEI